MFGQGPEKESETLEKKNFPLLLNLWYLKRKSFLLPIPLQVSYDGELHKHPQLEADLAAVREIYGPNAVSLRLVCLFLYSVTYPLNYRHSYQQIDLFKLIQKNPQFFSDSEIWINSVWVSKPDSIWASLNH